MVVSTMLAKAPPRAVFLSDLHLGWRWTRPHGLATLIGELSPESLYLVGDTFDWLIGGHFRWDAACQSIIRAIDTLRDRGSRVLLIPGNHDWQLAQHTSWHGWEIQSSAIHTTRTGTKFFVSHGDIFDRYQSMCGTDILRSFGRRLYPTILAVGARFESQGILPPPSVKHWCSYWKAKSRGARQHINRFRRFMCELAVTQGCDGVICGHVHSPSNQWTGTTQYLNCGDWVEHQTLVAETERGEIVLM